MRGLEDHPESKESPAKEWLEIRRDLASRYLPKSATVLALRHDGLTPQQCADLIGTPVRQVLGFPMRPLSDLKPGVRSKAVKLAKRLRELDAGRITWKDAIRKLGQDIDKDTIPLDLYLSLAARTVRVKGTRNPESDEVSPAFGSRKPCDVCGDARTTNIKDACEKCKAREKNRIHVRMNANRYDVPRGAILSAALATGLDENSIALILNATLSEIAKAKSHTYSARDQQRAAMFAQLIIDLYGQDAFPVIASGKAGEIRLGRLNKWRNSLPRGVMVITDRDKEFLDHWLPGKLTMREIGEKMNGHAFNYLRPLREKFGVESDKALLDKLKAYGLS